MCTPVLKSVTRPPNWINFRVRFFLKIISVCYLTQSVICPKLTIRIVYSIIMQQSSSSDDSDFCERFRNVRSTLIRNDESQQELDENYAYKQRIGDLIFDANFEGGNLGHVEQVDQFAYDLMVRPDVTNPRYRIWFNFTVSNQRTGQCVIFNFVNLSGATSLLSEGLTPVVRSRSKPNWIHLDPNQVFYYRSKNHSNCYVLSIAFKFGKLHDDEYQFALFFPYTISTLINFLSRWQIELKRRQKRKFNLIKKGKTFQSEGRQKSSLRLRSRLNDTPVDETDIDLNVVLFFKSILSKPIYEISITCRDETHNDKLIAIVLGSKSGCFESASLYTCQGLLDFMLSDHTVAPLARQNIELITFPTLDPDALWVGNSRSDLLGQATIDSKIVSLNPKLYEKYKDVERRVRDICAEHKNKVVIIELCVSSNLIGSRILGSRYTDSLRMEQHLHLPRLISRFSDAFYLEQCVFKNQPDIKQGWLNVDG